MYHGELGILANSLHSKTFPIFKYILQFPVLISKYASYKIHLQIWRLINE